MECVSHTELPAFGWQVESAVPEDEPLFQPFPPEIHFHGYKAFERYEALVYLRNNDKVSYSNQMELQHHGCIACRKMCFAGHRGTGAQAVECIFKHHL